MKKLLAIWFAICLAVNILFGVTLNFEEYMQRFASLPNFFDIFDGIVKACRAIANIFTGNIEFLDAIVSVAKLLWYLIKLPVDIIIYLVNVIIIVLPIGLGSVS